MSDNLRLAHIDWPLLADLRAAAGQLRKGHKGLVDALTTAGTRASAEDLIRLEVATRVGAPPGALLPLQVRANPQQNAQRAATWLADNGSDAVVDDFLIEVARAGSWSESPIPAALLLAYYSESYRLVVTWTVDEYWMNNPVYDGDDAILQAVGGLQAASTTNAVLIPPEDVSSIAAGLARLVPAPGPTGDLRPLYELWEDFYDPRQSLAPVVESMLAWLQRHYDEAARRGHGLWLIT